MSDIGGALNRTDWSMSRRPRVLVIFALLAVVLIAVALVCIERAAILDKIGRMWVVSDRFEPADAAVVLGGGEDTRPFAAAHLYEAGLVGRILVSNGGIDGAGADNLDRDELLRLGVPPTAITAFGDNPKSTYEEVRALAGWAEKYHARRIIMPTEIFPSRRVAWIARRELGKDGVHVMIDALSPSSYDLTDWWRNERGRADFATELVKYLYYRVVYWRS
jgi:uncharacterized SAM-binding protein YcdF (DUF218 family)